MLKKDAQIVKERIAAHKNATILHERVTDRIVTQLITEVFDKAIADQAIELIKRLRAIRWPTVSQGNNDPFSLFKTGTASAVAELQRAMAGEGREKNVFDKLVGLFKKDVDNPFTDVIAFANALYDFFTTMNKFVEAMGGEDDSTVSDIVGGETGLQPLQSIVTKGLSPNASGITAKLGTNWAKKYLGGLDVKQFVVGVSQMSKKQVRDVASQVMQQLSNVKDVVAKTVAAEDAVTHGKSLNTPEEESSTQSTKSDPTTQPVGSQPALKPEVKPGRQVDLQKAVLTKTKTQLEDAGVKDPARLINILDDLGVLKSPEA